MNHFFKETAMSWSFSIPATKRGPDFDAAVDAAHATGQPDNTPGLAEDIARAKDAVKFLGGRCKRAKVSATVSGHCLQPTEGKNVHDGLSASVTGSD